MYLNKSDIQPTCMLLDIVVFSTWMIARWKNSKRAKVSNWGVSMGKMRISTHKNGEWPVYIFYVPREIKQMVPKHFPILLLKSENSTNTYAAFVG